LALDETLNASAISDGAPKSVCAVQDRVWLEFQRNAQDATSAHYDTVHRFARHHNALSFPGSAPSSGFSFTVLVASEQTSNVSVNSSPQRPDHRDGIDAKSRTRWPESAEALDINPEIEVT